jgi:hypothetical protein
MLLGFLSVAVGLISILLPVTVNKPSSLPTMRSAHLVNKDEKAESVPQRRTNPFCLWRLSFLLFISLRQKRQVCQ